MSREQDEKIRELEIEVEFLRSEVARLRSAIAGGVGSVEDMLARRGLRIYKRGGEGLILPADSGPAAQDEYYAWLKKYSFRLFLRDVIKRGSRFRPKELVRYSSLETVEKFCGYLSGAGILVHEDGWYHPALSGVNSFGPTLEWFVSEVLRREYMADTVWGVRFKDTLSGGDYDVIAAVEGMLVYAEVKSSPPKQLYANEVAAFIDRIFELGPDLSIFVVDTELRMKDKVVVLFEESLPGMGLAGSTVERFKNELFHIDGRVFIINSKDSLTSNIGEVLGWYLRRSRDV